MGGALGGRQAAGVARPRPQPGEGLEAPAAKAARPHGSSPPFSSRLAAGQ